MILGNIRSINHHKELSLLLTT